MSLHKASLIPMILMMSLLMGCGTEQATLVPASGTLKIDGEPAAGIMVMFMPVVTDESIPAPTSQALTNDQGNFELVTLENKPGAVEGLHRVSLYDVEEERVAQGKEATRPRRLDPKFASGYIQVSIKEGTPIVLEATSPK